MSHRMSLRAFLMLKDICRCSLSQELWNIFAPTQQDTPRYNCSDILMFFHWQTWRVSRQKKIIKWKARLLFYLPNLLTLSTLNGTHLLLPLMDTWAAWELHFLAKDKEQPQATCLETEWERRRGWTDGADADRDMEMQRQTFKHENIEALAARYETGIGGLKGMNYRKMRTEIEGEGIETGWHMKGEIRYRAERERVREQEKQTWNLKFLCGRETGSNSKCLRQDVN